MPARTTTFNAMVLNGGGGGAFASVLESLEGCATVMPADVCHVLGIREGSTYDAAFKHCNLRMAHGMSPLL